MARLPTPSLGEYVASLSRRGPGGLLPPREGAAGIRAGAAGGDEHGVSDPAAALIAYDLEPGAPMGHVKAVLDKCARRTDIVGWKALSHSCALCQLATPDAAQRAVDKIQSGAVTAMFKARMYRDVAPEPAPAAAAPAAPAAAPIDDAWSDDDDDAAAHREEFSRPSAVPAVSWRGPSAHAPVPAAAQRPAPPVQDADPDGREGKWGNIFNRPRGDSGDAAEGAPGGGARFAHSRLNIERPERPPPPPPAPAPPPAKAKRRLPQPVKKSGTAEATVKKAAGGFGDLFDSDSDDGSD